MDFDPRKKRRKYDTARTRLSEGISRSLLLSWKPAEGGVSFAQCCATCLEVCRRLNLVGDEARRYIPYVMHLLANKRKRPRKGGNYKRAELDLAILKRIQMNIDLALEVASDSLLCRPGFIKESTRKILQRGKDIRKKAVIKWEDSSLPAMRSHLDDLGLWLELTLLDTFFCEKKQENFEVYRNRGIRSLDVAKAHQTFADLGKAYPGCMIEDNHLLLGSSGTKFLVIRRDLFDLYRLHNMHGYARTSRWWPCILHHYFVDSVQHRHVRDCMDHSVFRFVLMLRGYSESQVSEILLPPEDPMFGLYRMLPYILGMYRSVYQMTQDTQHKKKADACGLFRRQSLQQACDAFFCMRRVHLLAPLDALILYGNMHSDQYQSAKTGQESRLGLIKKYHREAFYELVRLSKRVDPTDSQKSNSPLRIDHVLLYKLCASGVLLDSDCRFLFLGIGIEKMERGNYANPFVRSSRRKSVLQSREELKKHCFKVEEGSSATGGGSASSPLDGVRVRKDLLESERDYSLQNMGYSGEFAKIGTSSEPAGAGELADLRAQGMAWFLNTVENEILGYGEAPTEDGVIKAQSCDACPSMPAYSRVQTLVSGAPLRFLVKSGDSVGYQKNQILVPHIEEEEITGYADSFGVMFEYVFCYPRLFRRCVERREYERSPFEDPEVDEEEDVESQRKTQFSFSIAGAPGGRGKRKRDIEAECMGRKLSLTRSAFGGVDIRDYSDPYDIMMGNYYFTPDNHWSFDMRGENSK